ncbi:3'-5' exonuclease [Pigmentiphaga aceris]|nr:3'-5' exonuclease [Pigmentiphaga aceris]
MQRPPPLARPTREQIAALPVYRALPPGNIHLLKSASQLEFAERELRAATHIGFDTESKPTFVTGELQTGPDLVQFATRDHAFIVQASTPGLEDFLRVVIESDEIIKVGVGIASDRPGLLRKFGLQLGKTIDVSFMLRALGYKDAVGLKTAVAIVLGQRLPKSKKTTTSNWAAKTLTPQQLQYAANDAHASLLIYHALSKQRLSNGA